TDPQPAQPHAEGLERTRDRVGAAPLRGRARRVPPPAPSRSGLLGRLLLRRLLSGLLHQFPGAGTGRPTRGGPLAGGSPRSTGSPGHHGSYVTARTPPLVTVSEDAGED